MHKAKRERQNFSSIVKNNAVMLGKIARYTPDYFLLMIAEGVIWGLLNSASALFTYNLLNAVDLGASFARVAGLIGLIALFYIGAYIFDSWYWRMHNPLMRKRLHLRMHAELFEKAHSLDLACFDDPEFYNDFVWAMNESDARAVEVIEDTGKLINRLVASGTLFGLLLSVDPVIAAILLGTSIVTVVANLIGNKVSFKHGKEANPLHRKRSYINRVFHLSDYAKELRINRADELLLADYDETTERLVELETRYGKLYFLLYGLGWNTLGNITFFAVIIYMITLLGGGLAVGGFSASVGVMWQIRYILTDLIERITKYPKHSLYIEKYLEFMHFTPRVVGEIGEIPAFESLEFRHVSFSYEFSAMPKYRFHEEGDERPKAEEGRDALFDVNFKLHAGEKIAIVGYNGAGKTTLIKLIMRMYDPSEGEILYNGINIREFDPEAYRKKIGTVFQDYKIFATSIAENVMNGEYREEDEAAVLCALGIADFAEKLRTLDDGIMTHLTREFNEKGTNLSGGEAQKIAISRVYAREYPIVIMDEPSSALDPIAEYNLNRSILENTASKTVIFISHRLSTTRIADRIYMFERGRLIEEGSHDALLEQNGKYAEMFRLQSEKYVDAVR